MLFHYFSILVLVFMCEFRKLFLQFFVHVEIFRRTQIRNRLVLLLRVTHNDQHQIQMPKSVIFSVLYHGQLPPLLLLQPNNIRQPRLADLNH